MHNFEINVPRVIAFQTLRSLAIQIRSSPQSAHGPTSTFASGMGAWAYALMLAAVFLHVVLIDLYAMLSSRWHDGA